MARFDHLREQGYDNLDRDVSLTTILREPETPRRPRRERVRVAGTMWKIGFWCGGILAALAAFGSNMRGGTRGIIFLGAIGGGVALGVLGLVIDGLTRAHGLLLGLNADCGVAFR